MNNQAAQTMPLPPSLPEWSRMDDLGGAVPSEVRQALIAMYQQGYAAALSQTAGVANLDAFIAKWEWLILSRCRDEFRADLAAMLAAAPAASGVHPDALPDGTLSKSTAKRVEVLAGASVSERARELLAQQYMGSKFAHLNAIGLCIRDGSIADDTAISFALRAIEQALTQQRGEVSAGDAVFAFSAMLTSLPHVVPFGACAWATPGAELATAFNEANGLSVSRDFPQGLKFPEIAGKLLGIVEKAAAQEDITPQPSADAVRELVKRILDWQPLTSMNKADRLYQILVAAGLPFDVIEDDLLSLLDGKGVGHG